MAKRRRRRRAGSSRKNLCRGVSDLQRGDYPRQLWSALNTGHNSTPTVEQRNQERAIALVIWLDSLLIVPYCAVAIWSGSLAMLAELLRGGLLLTVAGFSLRTLRRAHRGLIVDYDYGIGKLKRAVSGLVAALLFCAAAVPLRAQTGQIRIVVG